MNDLECSEPSWRPRISLLAALLLMTIVGMAIVIVQLWREVGPLRAEVDRLRTEVGYLPVDDPTKFTAVEVETRDDFIWRWRVWIPEGQVYVVRSFADGIPEKGIPANGGSIFIHDPGEHVIEYRIDRDRKDGKWYGSLVAAGGSVGKDEQPWVEWRSRTSIGGGIGKTARSFEPGKRFELIRHRVSKASDSSKMEPVTAGFMIWLEPASMNRGSGPAVNAAPPAKTAGRKQ
jgi:hypothetical protein